MKIINLVTCYSNENEVLNYAYECAKQSVASEVLLIVTVNQYGEMLPEEFKQKLQEVNGIEILCYEPEDNLGYLKGMLYGYQKYLEGNPNQSYEWVIMSNTDILYTSEQELQKFLGKIYEESIWCVAPSVYNPNMKSYGNPHYEFKISEKAIKRNIFIFSHPLLASIYFKLSKMKAENRKVQKLEGRKVYAVHGCYFILKKEFANYLLTKNFKPLMYSEEAYIAGKLEELGKEAYYDSDIEVLHMESTVTGKLNVGKKAQYFAESLQFILEENY